MKTHKNPEEGREKTKTLQRSNKESTSNEDRDNQAFKENEGISQPEKETAEVSDEKTDFPQEEPMDLSKRPSQY